MLDFEDYKSSMEQKLKELFVDKDGIEKDKYIKCKESDLKKQWLQDQKIDDQGRDAGYISESDAKMMVPEKPKAGRLYGVVKDHKSLSEGSKIPKLRE